MATINDALASLALERFDLPDWETRLPVRNLFLSGVFYDEFDENDEFFDDRKKIGPKTIAEHLEQFLSDLACSARPRAGDLRRMIPTSAGVWKFHPQGLRLYGWVTQEVDFVVVTFARAGDTKDGSQLNNRKLAQVIEFAEMHKLTGTVRLGDALEIFPPHN